MALTLDIRPATTAAIAKPFKSISANDTSPHKAEAWIRKPAPFEASPAKGVHRPFSLDNDAFGNLHNVALGELLKRKNYPELRKFQEPLINSLEESFRTNSFDKIQVQGEAGRGSSKVAYDIGNNQVMVVKEKSGTSLQNEILYLSLLKGAGIPTTDIHAVGTYRGEPAMILPKYEEFAKLYQMNVNPGAAQRFINSKLVNENTVKDLKTIRDVIKKHGFIWKDMRFGITPKGNIRGLDPQTLQPNSKDYDNKYQISTLNKLIAAIEQRLNSSR